jgi:hypothetical protein
LDKQRQQLTDFGFDDIAGGRGVAGLAGVDSPSLDIPNDSAIGGARPFACMGAFGTVDEEGEGIVGDCDAVIGGGVVVGGVRGCGFMSYLCTIRDMLTPV